jgi:hypothetical protein
MEVAVIGAGASGLMAAYASAKNGCNVTIYEKNEKCGKKIYITGKGRCNITNDITPADFLLNVVNNAKFLTSSIYSFPPERLIQFLEDGGLPIKIERGGRVFPQSDKASDVTKCLENYCRKAGVKFIFNTEILSIVTNNGTMSHIITKDGKFFYDKVIICTGGKSYPATGSTGDGYKFARELGHNVKEPKPALCGLNLVGDYYKEMQGLTLKNVSLSVFKGEKLIRSFFGEMLFTHFGISGPIVLSTSSLINRVNPKEVKLILDLKPALTDDQLDKRLLRDFEEFNNKSIANCLKNLIPNAMINEVLRRSNISPDKKVNIISKTERLSLLTNLKNFVMIVSSLRDFNEAIITSGGIDVSQVNPKTMESKLISGLYFCGEVLDVDAFTGGFNLQIAFSTGYSAGNSIKNTLE